MRGLLAILFACAVALGAYFFLFAPEPAADTNANATKSALMEEVRPPLVVGVTPVHGVVVSGLPQVISVRASEPLHDASTLSVARDGTPLTDLARAFAPDRLAMEVTLPSDSPASAYDVSYRACRSADLCGDGAFRFKVR